MRWIFTGITKHDSVWKEEGGGGLVTWGVERDLGLGNRVCVCVVGQKGGMHAMTLERN